MVSVKLFNLFAVRKLNKVLLVDDDNSANFLNKGIIANADFANEIVLKTNGKDAFEYLDKDCRSGKYPDLILLDLKMPEMDGFEFLKEFDRICHYIKDNVVIVILTSSNDADDYIKLIQMGTHYYVVQKPLDKNKFIDIHHRYFRGS